eukprot:scaffold1130_cov195-Pinguiococcus_pyrenoidosus.AAC.34
MAPLTTACLAAAAASTPATTCASTCRSSPLSSAKRSEAPRKSALGAKMGRTSVSCCGGVDGRRSATATPPASMPFFSVSVGAERIQATPIESGAEEPRFVLAPAPGAAAAVADMSKLKVQVAAESGLLNQDLGVELRRGAGGVVNAIFQASSKQQRATALAAGLVMQMRQQFGCDATCKEGLRDAD